MTQTQYPSRLVFLSACLGILLFGITLITLGSVAPEIQRKFQLSAISSGTLFSILPFGILAGSLVFGPVADRYGYKVILILSCLAIFGGIQGIAFANSMTVLMMCVFFFGLGGGAINGATNALVSDISPDNKAANLSILGVFFGVGALGMPFILGLLEKRFSVPNIVSTIGYLGLACALLVAAIRFPAAKQNEGVAAGRIVSLLRDNVLILASFFLFCQSGLEGLINNWTSTFLIEKNNIPVSRALYALSSYVAGITITRIVLGRVLRSAKPITVLLYSTVVLAGSLVVFHFANSYSVSVAGLVGIGVGLAAGFPVILGIIGSRYTDLSATAFSVAMSVALVGNIIINYSMGLVAEHASVRHLPIFGVTVALVMLLVALLINKKLNSTNSKQ